VWFVCTAAGAPLVVDWRTWQRTLKTHKPATRTFGGLRVNWKSRHRLASCLPPSKISFARVHGPHLFCGDLNYRIDLPREQVQAAVHEMRENIESSRDASQKVEQIRETLLRYDQLRESIALERAFPGFAEGKITFATTFKFDKFSGDYDTSHKQRIPAWTDRVLYKPDGTRVLEYDSVPTCQHSDHRPVYATFRVSLRGKELPPQQQWHPTKAEDDDDAEYGQAEGPSTIRML